MNYFEKTRQKLRCSPQTTLIRMVMAEIGGHQLTPNTRPVEPALGHRG